MPLKSPSGQAPSPVASSPAPATPASEPKPQMGTVSLDSILQGKKIPLQTPPPSSTSVPPVQAVPVSPVTESAFAGDIGTPPTAVEAEMKIPDAGVFAQQSAPPIPQSPVSDPFQATAVPQQSVAAPAIPVGFPQPVAPGFPQPLTQEQPPAGYALPGFKAPSSPFPNAQAPMPQQTTQSNVPALPNMPQVGFMWAPLGTELPRYPINRFKANEGRVYRVSLPCVENGIAIVRFHFDKDVGYFYCFNGKCCEDNGLPNVRYELPLLMYDTDMTGKPVSTKFELFFMQQGEEDYKSLIVLGANIPIADADFLITCSDEHYQKVKLQYIGPALWKAQGSPIQQQVLEKYNQVWKFVPMVVARSMTETEYLKAKAGDTPPVQPQQAEVTDLRNFLKR